MLLARAIRRAGSADVGAVRRAAANHRYDSPQGPVWVDPDNNHCFLTPRLARSVPGCQFNIFWEADAPERPDPYLSNLDLAAIGTRPERRNYAMTNRSPSADVTDLPSPFSVAAVALGSDGDERLARISIFAASSAVSADDFDTSRRAPRRTRRLLHPMDADAIPIRRQATLWKGVPVIALIVTERRAG